MRKRIVLLGATGSIGTQTLDVCRKHPELFEVVAVAAGRRVDQTVAAALEFGVRHVALASEECKGATSLSQLGQDVELGFGARAVARLACLEEADVIVNALSGAAGLRASYSALESGKVLALANKESLVVGGELIMPLATHDTLLPVDSEHSAIYQCLLGEDAKEMRRIWLTCSGGPFRGRKRSELAEVTAADALAHPTWNMGPKITIDSATLMNKGLEVIEAMHLFGTDADGIRVVVHPQSCVHSMVEYVDGSVKAHLGVADMRIPIQFALTYPNRLESPAEQVDFTKLHALEFMDPDTETFRCLALAQEAGGAGGTLPCVMNAANEVAVAAFLDGACRLTDIDACVEHCMEKLESEPVQSLEQLEEADSRARSCAGEWLALL